MGRTGHYSGLCFALIAINVDEKCTSCQENSVFIQCRNNKLFLKFYVISNCLIVEVLGECEVFVALAVSFVLPAVVMLCL